MKEDKTFPIEVVLSLTTGVLLVDKGFGEMHQFAEHVAGHSIFTHEFAEKALWTALSERVFAQHQALRDAEEFKQPSNTGLASYLEGYVARARERFGTELSIAPGTGERTENPIESWSRISGGKPLLAVVVPPREPE